MTRIESNDSEHIMRDGALTHGYTLAFLLRPALAAMVFAFCAAAPPAGMAEEAVGQSETATRPNVVIVITDDQGYGDLACHGNPIIQTPHMDALHAQSVRLTEFHVDPTCAPTRSALLTGCYSHRVKVWHTITGRNMLARSATTMADVFRRAGYRTAHFGKWHLGTNYPYRPIDRGFETWLGQGDGGTGTTTDHWGNDRVNDVYLRGGRIESIEGYAPDVFFEEAISYVRSSARASRRQPFFVYLATYVPHSPWAIPEIDWVDRYRDKVPLRTAYFFASISRVDENLGRLRRCLEEEGVAENTLLIFMTDNGSSGGFRVFNAGMRDHKGSHYDGGHRVPCFIHWPAGGLDKPRNVDRLTAHFDLLPTLIDLCGIEQPESPRWDGRSLKPLLYDPEAAWKDRALVVESQRIDVPEKGRKFAVMSERWRLVDGRELYDIQADPGQQRDLAGEHPSVVTRLRRAYDQYWESVSRDDEAYQRPIIGAGPQRETYLCSEDWRPLEGYCAWSQAAVAKASPVTGEWLVEVARNGRYRFEVRRWPRELDVPITGKPTYTAEPDAWLNDEPIRGTLYRAEPEAVPVASIRLRVGREKHEAAVSETDRAKVFTVELPEGELSIEAQLLDAEGKVLSGAYYVYVRLCEFLRPGAPIFGKVRGGRCLGVQWGSGASPAVLRGAGKGRIVLLQRAKLIDGGASSGRLPHARFGFGPSFNSSWPPSTSS